jgi:hypothetical protein
MTTRTLAAGAALAVVIAVSPAAASAQRERPAGPRASGLPRAHLKQATAEELTQFHNELERAGWQSPGLAPIPSAYHRSASGVHPVRVQFATLQGDLDGDGQPEWVVGYHFPPQQRSGAAASAGSARADDRARIAVFRKETSGDWRLTWVSPGLGYEFGAPRFNVREVELDLDHITNLRPPLALVDIDRDGKLEIAYYCWSELETLGGLPGVYRFDGARWVSVAPQADRFSLRDLNRDGALEVITGSRFVGHGMGDDDVPRVWRWNGRQYQEASSEFPAFYADLRTRYDAHVRRMERAGEKFERAVWERAIRKAASLAG